LNFQTHSKKIENKLLLLHNYTQIQTHRTMSSHASATAFKTDIHGIPASYALCQVPGEPDGTYSVVKVVDVPSHDNLINNSLHSDTPMHLCDRSKLITQHRLGNSELPHRTIDPAIYDQCEIDWYGAGVLPTPLYMCFIIARKCYLCGDMQASSDNINGECTENFKEGYRYCNECAPYFRQALYKTLAPIWRFRLAYEQAKDDPNPKSSFRVPIWVHRTRRDESGKSDRTNSGRPFRYTRWFVSSWIPQKSINKNDPNPENHFEEDLICVEEWNVSFGDPMSKLVSVMDVFFANQGSLCDPNYDPNVDDPLNQIRHMTLDEKQAIMRRDSAPFE
jgi:hypothetical protein